MTGERKNDHRNPAGRGPRTQNFFWKKIIIYTVCTDEAADVGNLKQLPLVLRYIDTRSQIWEELIYFIHCENETTRDATRSSETDSRTQHSSRKCNQVLKAARHPPTTWWSVRPHDTAIWLLAATPGHATVLTSVWVFAKPSTGGARRAWIRTGLALADLPAGFNLSLVEAELEQWEGLLSSND